MDIVRTEFCVSIDTPKENISMCAFWRDEPKNYQMSSGYLIEITNKQTSKKIVAECLDADHVWRELKAHGYDKTTRKFIIKHR